MVKIIRIISAFAMQTKNKKLREVFMLDFIKKYRNDPRRTVVTFVMNEKICFNKLGDLNVARAAKNEHEKTKNDNENDNFEDKENRVKTKRAFKERESSALLDSNEKVLFDECSQTDSCSCGSESEGNGNETGKGACECDPCISPDCSCSFGLPCSDADLKGGINSEKKFRVLLCDLVAGSVLVMGAVLMKKVVFRHK